ncbi:uncharacterized protein [Triticum aestivum]|uniref:uncharacterized protein isoform X1 n=1 Tax=Triticum aestivum TaxID=4565 RepID=UPI001D01D87D|nr:uncharacterized protein LOC123054437 isoform X1 [Triticum aestivum]
MLGEYCADLSDMHKARHYYRVTSLSEEEKLYLHQIDDFATATIAEYEASVGPVPAFDNHLSLFSQEIPLEFPEPLAPPPASSSSASVRLRLRLLTTSLLWTMEGMLHAKR